MSPLRYRRRCLALPCGTNALTLVLVPSTPTRAGNSRVGVTVRGKF